MFTIFLSFNFFFMFTFFFDFVSQAKKNMLNGIKAEKERMVPHHEIIINFYYCFSLPFLSSL